MIVLRKNDIPSVVGDNSGRDKAEREDMDARRRQKRSKREWLKEGEEETDSKPSWNFLFGIWHCTAYLPLDTSYLCGNRVVLPQQNKHCKHTCSGLERRRR